MNYAQQLKKLMKLKGYSMYRLAKEMPCSQTAVKKWLNGSMPNPVMRARIAEILGELPEVKEIPAPSEGDGNVERFREVVTLLFGDHPEQLSILLDSLEKEPEKTKAKFDLFLATL